MYQQRALNSSHNIVCKKVLFSTGIPASLKRFILLEYHVIRRSNTTSKKNYQKET